MIINGVDVSALAHTAPKVIVPNTVPGRVVQIDADFLAYQVSADDEKSFADMCHNCDVATEKLRLMAGAEKLVLHLTPRGSDKGMRYDLALLKEYQANRADKPKPKFLHAIREWMHKERGAIMHAECEADDGMSIAQYTAIKEGNRHLSIIASKDKDLTMVPGLMLNWDTGEITDTEDDFGWITLDDSKSSKKIRGRGHKFFWAQMLTGDTADNISGLPLCCSQEYLPNGKPKKVGPVFAYGLLSTVSSNREAFTLVRGLFEDCHAHQPFVDWRDGKEITPGRALASEAQLLWMRRKLDFNDVLHWMKEECT